MKKNQGAKSRSTFMEARYGDAAGYGNGLVGFVMLKKRYYRLKSSTLYRLEQVKTPGHANIEEQKSLHFEVKELGEEIAFLLAYAPDEYPHFLEHLAKAEGVKKPVYPAEVLMFKKYNELRYGKMMINQPKDVLYSKLYELVVDDKGKPTPSTFSRMVKRYGLNLVKKPPGRP